MERQDKVHLKGKGFMQTYWLQVEDTHPKRPSLNAVEHEIVAGVDPGEQAAKLAPW